MKNLNIILTKLEARAVRQAIGDYLVDLDEPHFEKTLKRAIKKLDDKLSE